MPDPEQLCRAICALLLPALVIACEDETSPPEPTPATTEAKPESETPEATEPKPVPEPHPLQAAFDAGEYQALCQPLEAEGFPGDVCAFLAARASGERGSLNQRNLEQFLRAQQVRQLSGSIVEVYEQGAYGTTYEIRWSGRTALLESEDTQFETTGRFRMWAQRTPNDEQVVFDSGRSRDIPAFVEWKLADDLLEIARRNPEDAQALAQRTFQNLAAR